MPLFTWQASVYIGLLGLSLPHSAMCWLMRKLELFCCCELKAKCCAASASIEINQFITRSKTEKNVYQTITTR